MRVSFVVDGMLGSTARKLRIFGFDTLYMQSAEDVQLLETGLAENRTLVTSDKLLHGTALRRGLNSVLLTQGTDEERLTSLFRHLGITPQQITPEATRCAVCNGELARLEKSAAEGLVPRVTYQNHGVFYRCSTCAKIYWQGGHWRRILLMARKVRRKLAR